MVISNADKIHRQRRGTTVFLQYRQALKCTYWYKLRIKKKNIQCRIDTYSVRGHAQVLTLIRGPMTYCVTCAVMLQEEERTAGSGRQFRCYFFRGAPSVYIPTDKFDFLGFLEDDSYVGGGGSRGRRVYAKLTKTSENKVPPGPKKRPRQSSLHDGYSLAEISNKIVSATIFILFLTIFRYNLYLFTNFFDPEAFRSPSCFFKTLKVFGITPLRP